MPALGRVILEDAESGAVLELNTQDPRLREQFANRQARRQEALGRFLRSAGIDAIRLETGEPYGAALGKFFETREKRRLRRAG